VCNHAASLSRDGESTAAKMGRWVDRRVAVPSLCSVKGCLKALKHDSKHKVLQKDICGGKVKLTTRIFRDLKEESAEVWHTAGGTKCQKYQAEYGEKKITLVSKEEEEVLKDALRQGKVAEQFVWEMDQGEN